MEIDNLVALYHYTNEDSYQSIMDEGVVKAFSKPYGGFNDKMKRALDDYGTGFSELERLMSSKKNYLLGLNNPLSKGWINYGLMKELINFLSYKETGVWKPEVKDIYCFKLFVKPKDVIVREFKYMTAKYAIESFSDFGNDRPNANNKLIEISDIINNPGVESLINDAEEKLMNNDLKSSIWKSFRHAQRIAKSPKELWKMAGLTHDDEQLRVLLIFTATITDYFNSSMKLTDYNGDYVVPEFWYAGDYQVESHVKKVKLRSDSGEPTRNFKILTGGKEITKEDKRAFQF